MEQVLSIGVDIGGSHIASAAVLSNGQQILDTTYAESPVNSKGSADEILSSWSSCINQTIRKTPAFGTLVGIGVAMPGAFNYQKGIALFEETDKYNALYGLEISRSLLPLLNYGFDGIRFINDATAFALGASQDRQFLPNETNLSVVLGTGFGTALIRSGLPVTKGPHVPKHGCFWHLPFRDSIADDYFSTRWFVSEFQKLSDVKVNGVKEIASAYKSDPNAKIVFDRFGTNLGEFFTSWIEALQIKNITLGGKISNALPYFVGPFKNALKANQQAIAIDQNLLLEKASIIGSSLLTDDSYWKKIMDGLPTR